MAPDGLHLCTGSCACRGPPERRDSSTVLHVTNGDSAAQRLRDAGIGGQVLPWRDVLHEGPVPAGLDDERLRVARARFAAALGWASEERLLADMGERDARLDGAIAAGEGVVLWFETDLYDMLQLAQVLDRLRIGAAATLVLVGEREFAGVAELGDDELRAALAGDAARARARTVDERVATAGRDLWAAFRAPEPDAIGRLAAAGTPALPALGQAAARLLEQFPWRATNVNRTERALLQAVADGAATPVEAFRVQQESEERPFMGDATVFEYLRRLGSGRGPLLQTAGGRLALTGLGRAVLDGAREWEERPERWLGGVRLPPGSSPWRYDPATGRLAGGAS